MAACGRGGVPTNRVPPVTGVPSSLRPLMPGAATVICCDHAECG